VRAFRPEAVVVSAGFDGHKDDPIAGFLLTTEAFLAIGSAIAALDRPTVVVQEGGYDTVSIGECVRSLLLGVSKSR